MTILKEMDFLIEWAKAYEEEGSVVEDNIYDMQIRALSRLEEKYPEEWEQTLEFRPMFRDGSWKYTGSFYHG